MTDRLNFEAHLADVFERYLAGAPIEVDADRLAADASGASPRRMFALPSVDRRRWALALALALLALALAATAVLYVGRQNQRLTGRTYQGIFSPAGEMMRTRMAPVVATLSDGRVLIAASEIRTQSEVGPDAEIYDPAAGTSVSIVGDTPSGVGAGILLRDGRVLTVTYDSNTTSSYAYVFDPVRSTFHPLKFPGFSNAPPFGVEPSMAFLQDGSVLVSGGQADVYKDDILASAMIFDPATETFSPTGSMLEGRRWHSLTTLADGRVLVVGGEGKDPTATSNSVGSYLKGRTFISSVEMYDPGTGTFAPLATRSSIPGATLGSLLPDGRVLIAPRGGINDELWLESGLPDQFDVGHPPRLEIFDPMTSALTPGPILPGTAATATLLDDGRVLLTGEHLVRQLGGDVIWEPWSAFYDPSTGTILEGPRPDMRLAPAAMLPDGRVILAGGIWPGHSANVSDVPAASRLLIFE